MRTRTDSKTVPGLLLPKEFGTVNAIDCSSESTLYVGEVGNFRVQKVTMK